MKILFSGDSITKGQQGVSYVKKVEQVLKFPKIDNIAVNGESLNMMVKRLTAHLKKKNDYDLIIIAGGLADVSLASFLELGALFKFAFWAQNRIGMRLNDTSEDFEKMYQALIQACKELCHAKIMLLTLNCAGEKLDGKWNDKRKAYNTAIKHVAQNNNLLLADAASAIDKYLQVNCGSSYMLENFWKVTYSDKFFTLTDTGSDWLSRNRGLKVTIDGIHLNSKGAELFADAVINVLKNNFPEEF